VPEIIIVTAPSGAGKTTIVRHLIESFDFLKFSVSATTRAPRSHEVDGKDYHFLSRENFHARVGNGDFLEWEEVYRDQFYGTLKSEVARIAADGHVAIFDIEVHGASTIKAIFGQKALAVYVAPPSMSELEKRLRSRGTESEESVQKRLRRADAEMKRIEDFDLVLINDYLERSLKLAKKIVDKNFSTYAITVSS